MMPNTNDYKALKPNKNSCTIMVSNTNNCKRMIQTSLSNVSTKCYDAEFQNDYVMLRSLIFTATILMLHTAHAS
jgi:hypothetical protein